MRKILDLNDVDDYRFFVKAKTLPQVTFDGRVAIIPDEYAHLLGMTAQEHVTTEYRPSGFLFDYQAAIAKLAIRKRKFAAFVDCGYGKSLILLEYARHVADMLPSNQCVLIVSPLMVVRQTLKEAKRFYGDDIQIEHVVSRNLGQWLESGTAKIGITNYEAITEKIRAGRLGSLILDESSLLKSAYGAWGQRLIELGRGLDWKLCLTGTPAPNDRIEYANHAVFLDQFITVNSFLAKFFVNRGQTDNRWELKKHALRPFYRSLSHWSIFLSDPAVYGFRDNVGNIPPIHVSIEGVPLTDAQRELVSRAGGDIFGTPGGITSRSKLSQLAKGKFGDQRIESVKPAFIRDRIATWPDESTLVWCLYNDEQDRVASAIPDSVSMTGATPEDERQKMLDLFTSGTRKVLVSKSKILGFGLNLQIATRQVFSGLVDSFESYYQCVKRSNRVGSTRPLNVHIPVTEIERPMIETVLRKAKMIEQDTIEQQMLFKEVCYSFD